MIRFLSVALSLVVAVASFAADKPAAIPAWQEAGKADAKAAFASQAKTAPKPAPWPTFVGEYLWSGRADEAYKPFFMFELRLRGPTKPIDSAKYRVVTLDPLRKPQTSGPWIMLGALAPNDLRDLSYKLNCPTFQAFQIEMTWKEAGKDVQETYLVWDKVAMLPVALSEVANVPFLIALYQNFEHDSGRQAAGVSFMQWNIGGKPAKDVQQTVHFKDDGGKTVASHTLKVVKELAAGHVGQVKFIANKIPPFASISIATKMTENTALDPGSFTGVEDVEIAQVRAEGKAMKAKVRNGFKAPLVGVTVLINLIDGGNKTVKALSLPVGDMKAGEEREVSADISGVGPWNNYEVAWKSTEQPPTSPVGDVPKAPSQPVMLVDGLEFTVVSTKPEKDGLAVSGLLRNKRDADLEGLVVSFSLPVPGKENSVVTLKPGRLIADGDGVPVNFIAAGVKDFTGMSLKWVSTKKQ